MAWLWQRDIDDEKRAPDIIYMLRSAFLARPPGISKAAEELKALGISPGWKVLDFGCGPGNYSIAAAMLVGSTGAVFAMDLHPKALDMVEGKAAAHGLRNIETIFSDLDTGLDSGSIDSILLFSALKRRAVRPLLDELHRIVKASGTVHVRNPGLKKGRLEDLMVKDGLFHLTGRHGDVLHFGKLEGEFHEI